MLIKRNTFDWVRCSGWRDGPSRGNQVRETLCYFMDFYLARLPLLCGLILRTPSSVGLGRLPALRPGSLVGLEFPALLVVDMFLAAVGAVLVGLMGCLGWGNNDGCSRCLYGGKELLKHGTWPSCFSSAPRFALEAHLQPQQLPWLEFLRPRFFPPLPCLRCPFRWIRWSTCSV